MDARLFAKMDNALAGYNTLALTTVPGALAFASFVLDNVCKAEDSTSIDSMIDKAILLHALRQLDRHHRQAVTIHVNQD